MSTWFMRVSRLTRQITRARRPRTSLSIWSARSARSCRSPPCSRHEPSCRARSCVSTTRTRARRNRTMMRPDRRARPERPACADLSGPYTSAGHVSADLAQLPRLPALRRRAMRRLGQTCPRRARLPPSLYIDQAPRFGAAEARWARPCCHLSARARRRTVVFVQRACALAL